jgi:L-2-hydroxyglutarate oxidase LhgO
MTSPDSGYLYDYVVVGSGIVGLAVAWELKNRHPGSRILILEKEKKPGCHASGRNSGVLHSGIYYPGHTLKAKVCSIGARRMRQFAEERSIPCLQRGKIIMATSEAEQPALAKLLQNARDNRIRAEPLDEAGVRALEPHAHPRGTGVYCPDTAVIDSLGVVTKLGEELESKGVGFEFGKEVMEIDPIKKEVSTTAGGKYGFGFLFNCAGAYADVLAKKMGLCQDYALVPFKGAYYKLHPSKSHLVRSSLYPVPDPELPFLGVHLTKAVNGDVYIGPTAMPALGRENYGFIQGIKVGECLAVLACVARLYINNAGHFRRLVHTEMRKFFKPYFLKCVQRLVPEVRSEDLVPSPKVGIRPQLVDLRTSRLEMDYVLERTPESMHVLNAISPAFTSAFAFAELIVDRFERRSADAPRTP